MDNRSQILYQKTDFNSSLICMLPNIFRCSKCKKNNVIHYKANIYLQMCAFCGMPNLVKKLVKK
uniref:Uncharacterized protein n=1 Tax=viral metagenome TaxID=1070528 RepID=A0A6C0EQY7_9ZZZZ